MVKLFCAIVGVAGSAFEVDIDDGGSVAALKDAIKGKNSKTITCDAKDLQLFLAKKADGAWLSSKDPGVISMRSGVIPEQVKTLMNVEVDPADDIGDVFEGAPTKKTVHVLVVVPEAVGGSVSEASKLDQLVDKVDRLYDQLNKTGLGKRKVCHSSANSSLLNTLHVRVRSSRAVQFKTDNSVQPFPWAYTVDEHGDKIWLAEEQQRDRYREYVQVNIDDALARNELCVCGVEKGEGGEDLLSVDVPGHNITLVGRTDLIILSDQVLENPVEVKLLPDVRLIIEVKREVKPSSINQTVSELIALDIMVAEQVMALLTDFGKHWQFFWVADPTNSEGTIQSVIINNPSRAFAVIRTLLDQSPSAGADAAIGLPCVKAPIKRHKLSAVLASSGEDNGTGIRESLERYYDIASMLGPDIEMARAVARQITRSIPTLSYFS
ncbi:hypothetical protein F442_01724 [Phytophthora nicotianae P10297]|uniref:Crinkler effector protein N-terminal domain-containing protein n=2 Tax=Phytophthora nicotianae TaxID=4792 RepID=W3A299_PHYNI|nr:hypothetical protein F442_01724 [Phytophthora nicotianae P10297]